MQVRKLKEYTLHGSIIKQVCLSSDLANPRHAILLTTGQFVVSFTDFVCLVGGDGKCVQPKNSSSSSNAGQFSIFLT
jgi:hypothetical protein